MKLWSISFSYRLGLGFHALNNEGSEGSNLMQPRRIDVGKTTYDGISGEMIRRHILENFVNICRADGIAILPVSAALHPDRGPLGIRKTAKNLGSTKLTKQNPTDLYRAVREAIKSCAVLDVGGFLAPFSERAEPAEGGGGTAVAPEAEIEKSLAEIGGRNDGGAPYTVKRDSVFDVAWLISEKPQDLAITQHSAYRPSGGQSLFSQTMRSNTYAGIIRAELHRIGTDDYWYLHAEKEPREAVTSEEQKKRQMGLVKAIVNFIASPTGAKVAGWAPHVFLAEGAVLLTSDRTAPFSSPIRIEIGDSEGPVKANPSYAESMKGEADKKTSWAWTFAKASDLLAIVESIQKCLDGNPNAKEESKTQ